MTRQVINTGTVANDGTGDSLRQAGQKINDNFVEIYGIVGDSAANVRFAGDGVAFDGPDGDGTEIFLTSVNPTVSRTQTLPDLSGDVVITAGAQTLTDKTLTSAILTSPTIPDASEDHNYTITSGELSADRNIQLPVITGNDVLVSNTSTSTLTNKTLTSPTMSGPSITDKVVDANGADIITLTATGSAVNDITVTNAATGTSPSIQSSGTDANIGLTIAAKGTGAILVNTKLAYFHETKTGGGAISTAKVYTSLNSGSGQAATLADGTVTGQVKKITNKGAGTYTITPTSMAQGTSFTLSQNGACELIWDGTNWFIVNDASSYISIT